MFLFTFLVSFSMTFLAQKLIYTLNIWFNFVPGSFFEQDHLLKSDPHLSKKNCVVCLIESHLKLMKNAFCFILKAFYLKTFFHYIYVFVSTFCSCRKNSLIRKISLTLKFMTLQRISHKVKATKQWHLVN